MQHFNTDNPFLIKLDPSTPIQQGPLDNKRLAVKDLFHIAGQPTSAGNPDWLNTHPIPQHTSSVVSNLQKHGAIVVGKTITDELAYSLNGQNIHYGTPINSKNPSLLPGGSSSGSAIAVANGSADIGLGTDTGGSIRIPASYNGLFGFRPSHGVISTDNMVALAPSFDTVGWITRDFNTLMSVANILLPFDSKPNVKSCFTLGFSTAINAQCEQGDNVTALVADLASAERCTQVDLSNTLHFNHLTQVSSAFRVLQGAEIWHTHGNWIESTQPSFAPDIKQRFAWCSTINEQQVTAAQRAQQQFIKDISAIFEVVDYILVPTTPGHAPSLNASDIDLTDYRNTLLSMTCIAGLAGLPQLHIPLSIDPKFPSGLSVIGKKYDDQGLFQFAQILMEFL